MDTISIHSQVDRIRRQTSPVPTDLLPLPEALPIWLLAGLVMAASVAWARVGRVAAARWPWLWGLALGAALIATLAATLMPMELPAGFVPPRATFDPTLGLRQILLIDDTVRDAAVSQAWAAGNLVLLWPLAAALSLKLSSREVLARLAALIVSIELVQGLTPALGRSFEVSDLVANLAGAALFLWLVRKTFQSASLSPTMRP